MNDVSKNEHYFANLKMLYERENVKSRETLKDAK